jgi:hypothetical protein
MCMLIGWLFLFAVLYSAALLFGMVFFVSFKFIPIQGVAIK